MLIFVFRGGWDAPSYPALKIMPLISILSFSFYFPLIFFHFKVLNPCPKKRGKDRNSVEKRWIM